MITEDKVREIVRDELDTRSLNADLAFIVRHNPKAMIRLAAKRPEVKLFQQYAEIAQKAINERPGFFSFFRSK